MLDLDGECKFIKNKTYSYYRNSYILGCHLGWVNKRFRIQKVAAKNIIISLTTTTLIAILKTPSGSISFNSWLLHHIIDCSNHRPHINHTQSAIYSSEAIVRHITTTSVLTTIFPVNLKAYLFTQSEYNWVSPATKWPSDLSLVVKYCVYRECFDWFTDSTWTSQTGESSWCSKTCLFCHRSYSRQPPSLSEFNHYTDYSYGWC